MKLTITAPPVDGKANKAVIKFLASFLNMRKKDFCISHGLHSRTKTVLIAGLELKEIQTRIEAAAF